MTRVNWTKQAGLAAVLLVLGTTAYWAEYKHKPEKESQEEQNKKIFGLKDIQVRGLALKDGAGHVYEIKCSDVTAKLCKPGDNSKWEVAQPLKLKADDANVNVLVSALNNLNISETIDLKEETPEKRAALLKEYGLDTATRELPTTKRVSVETPNGTTVLYLGFNHPIGDSLFGVTETVGSGQSPTGKVDENKVYLVPTYFKANFDHDLTYWRDKKLMTASAHEIEALKLVSSKASIGAERKEGQWTLKTAQGDTLPGDIENIDNVLTAATFLTAKGIVADKKTDSKALATLKGMKAVLTLTLQQEKGSNKELPAPIALMLFQKAGAKAGDKLYATVSNLDPLYELESTARDRLNKEVKDLRLTKLITSMERFTAKKLTFSGKPIGSTPLILKSTDSKWSVDGEKSEPNAERIQGLLDRLSGNRITEFLTGSAIPAGEQSGITVQLADDKGDDKRKLVFWKDGAKLFARDLHATTKEAFRVDPAVSNDLPWTRDFFMVKDAPLVPPPGTGNPHAGIPGGPPDPGKPLIPMPPTGNQGRK